jgi:chemotaxis protein CheD
LRSPATDIYVNSGGFEFVTGRVRLRTVLGSCVAITAWHPARRMGGMCHYLLAAGAPGPGSPQQSPDRMYAGYAADMFERAFRETATCKDDYVVKMFGGGSMFPEVSAGQACETACDPAAPPIACRDVPCRNVTQGKFIFETRGFTIVCGDVGGLGSRQLIFDVWTGDVWVRRTRIRPL